jgi:hypothetical protein
MTGDEADVARVTLVSATSVRQLRKPDPDHLT